MQRTVLQVVQSYLTRTSGFPVNSIFETEEAYQAAEIIQEVYYRMVQEYPNLLFTQKDRTLDSVSDPDRPNFLLIPDEINDIRESKIYYNTARDPQDSFTLAYKPVRYLPPLEFLERTSRYFDSDENTMVVTGFDNQKMVILTNNPPDFCTSFDGKYITFNSFDKEQDTSLQASKSRVVSTEIPVFVLDNDFIPPVPERLSETFLDMCLADLYSSLRQEENATLNQRSRRARIKMQQDSRQMGSGGRAKTRYGRPSNIQSFGRRNERFSRS